MEHKIPRLFICKLRSHLGFCPNCEFVINNEGRVLEEHLKQKSSVTSELLLKIQNLHNYSLYKEFNTLLVEQRL